MEDHSLSNKNILKKIGMSSMNTYIELRRAYWLEKLVNMRQDHIPRMLLEAWIQKSRRNGTAGRSQQTIRHAYVNTLNTL